MSSLEGNKLLYCCFMRLTFKAQNMFLFYYTHEPLESRLEQQVLELHEITEIMLFPNFKQNVKGCLVADCPLDRMCHQEDIPLGMFVRVLLDSVS